MFLGQMEAKHRALRERVQEIRGVLTGAAVPGPGDPGVTNGLRIPFDVRDRIIEIQGRHGLRSSKEALYKAMMLGLMTLERLEPANGGHFNRNHLPSGHRVLSPEEVTRLKDEGFGATR